MPRSLSLLICCLFLICFCCFFYHTLCEHSPVKFYCPCSYSCCQSLPYPLQLATCPAFVYDCNWALLSLMALSHMFIAFVLFYSSSQEDEIFYCCVFQTAAQGSEHLLSRVGLESIDEKQNIRSNEHVLKENSVKARISHQKPGLQHSEQGEELEPILDIEQSQELMCGLTMKITKKRVTSFGSLPYARYFPSYEEVFLSFLYRWGNEVPKMFYDLAKMWWSHTQVHLIPSSLFPSNSTLPWMDKRYREGDKHGRMHVV